MGKKIVPEEIISSSYTNGNGDVYTVVSYQGKTASKYMFEIQFEETKNKQFEDRNKIINGKCRDLLKEKALKSIIKQHKLKERARLSKTYIAEYKKFDMQDKHILSLDQASNTGYCVILNNSIKKYGLIEKKYNDFYVNAGYIIKEITRIIIKYDVKIIILEDIYLGMDAKVLEKLAGLKGMLISCAVLNQCEYEIINANSWKTFHNLGYDREEQKNESIKKAKEILKNADIDDNIADAVLIGIYAAKNLKAT